MPSVPNVGEVIVDRYYVEDVLNAGERSVTLKCFDKRLDVDCAIKILIGDERESDWETRRKRFIESFRAQARMNHPNIVHVANIEMKQGMTMAVMELLHGMTLDEYVRTETLNSKTFIELFLSIVDAVSMAHSMGIIHKSICPKHIFLNEQGGRLSPRILSFASQYDVSELDVHTRLPFLSPEQFESFDKATESSDVYSLCATMYYAFAGKAAVEFSSLNEYLAYHIDNGGLLSFPDDIPVDFVPLIQVGINESPEGRFKNASELLKALKDLGSGFKLSANLSIEASKSYPALTPIDLNDAAQTRSPSGATPSRPFLAKTPSKSLVTAGRIPSRSSQVSSSASQSIMQTGDGISSRSPSSLLRNLAPDARLPKELEGIYQIRRIDSVSNHAWIGAVSTIDNPNGLYILKCFHAQDEVARKVFNEGTRRSEILARENAYFQSIYARYTDSAAILMPEQQRQSLPACIEENGVLEPSVAVQISILLGQAMEAAHGKGFVNGNLKPSNIIFENRNGVVTPVIYDFGQRLYVTSAEQLELTDLPFVAPELRFNLQNSNVQTDIYAFGMLLCYMVTGRLPYRSRTISALSQEILNSPELPDISGLRPGIPTEILQIIRWCAEYNPTKRYARFSDVLKDLYVVFQALNKA